MANGLFQRVHFILIVIIAATMPYTASAGHRSSSFSNVGRREGWISVELSIDAGDTDKCWQAVCIVLFLDGMLSRRGLILWILARSCARQPSGCTAGPRRS